MIKLGTDLKNWKFIEELKDKSNNIYAIFARETKKGFPNFKVIKNDGSVMFYRFNRIEVNKKEELKW